MKTVEQIRRDWLLRLLDKYGTLAALNTALGRERTDGTLMQIKNQAPNTYNGKARIMGSDLAREIESKLGMELGTLDNEYEQEAENDPVMLETFELMHHLDSEGRRDALGAIRVIVNTKKLNDPKNGIGKGM